jgi:hypothetical protein
MKRSAFIFGVIFLLGAMVLWQVSRPLNQVAQVQRVGGTDSLRRSLRETEERLRVKEREIETLKKQVTEIHTLRAEVADLRREKAEREAQTGGIATGLARQAGERPPLEAGGGLDLSDPGEQVTLQEQQVPVLSDIPLLGRFFRSAKLQGAP